MRFTSYRIFSNLHKDSYNIKDVKKIGRSYCAYKYSCLNSHSNNFNQRQALL